MAAKGKLATFRLELYPDCSCPWQCTVYAGPEPARAEVDSVSGVVSVNLHTFGSTPEVALERCIKLAELAGMVVLRGPAQGDVELAALSLFLGRAIYYAGRVPA